MDGQVWGEVVDSEERKDTNFGERWVPWAARIVSQVMDCMIRQTGVVIVPGEGNVHQNFQISAVCLSNHEKVAGKEWMEPTLVFLSTLEGVIRSS